MNFFDVIIVQPIFNLLMLVYGIIPDFGISIIIFTIIIRFLLWPLAKKQINQAKAMRAMQPELQKIKKKHKNNRQAQSLAMMDLYKKHNISPFGSIGILLIQLPILIGMYQVVRIFVLHRDELGKFTYGILDNMPVVHNLVQNPDQFNNSFLGVMDLTQQAVSQNGTVFSLLILALAVSFLQYFVSKQMSPTDGKKTRKLRDILSEASQGKEADQSEMNAIVMQKMMKFMPIMLFFIMISLPGALSLYMATSSLVAYGQNALILKQNEEAADKSPNSKSGSSKKGKNKPSPSAKKRADNAKEAKIIRIKAKD